MRRIVLLGPVALLASLALPMSGPMSGLAAQAEDHLPEDCRVPDDVDLTGFNIIVGTEESELIRGTPRPDFICGRLGDDVILAGSGGDLVLSDTTTFFGDPGAAGG